MIYQGDCLEIMPTLPDKSIDMILCDLPYGTTACKWDTIIPFKPLWAQYKRLIKDNGAIVLTASQPFTSALVMSNVKMFKYCWVWEKLACSGGIHAKNKPLKKHEDICIFSPGVTVHKSQSVRRMTYNPQGLKPLKKPILRKSIGSDVCSQKRKSHKPTIQTIGNYPGSILKINSVRGKHPTQKPVALFEYLVKTYTNEGDTVLDNCAGSGTTAIAAIKTNRKYILIEKDPDYFKIIENRIYDETRQGRLF